MTPKYSPLPANFDCDAYRKKHKCFKNLTDIELKIHYIAFNKLINQTGLPEDFNPKEYARCNPDIPSSSVYYLIKHYIFFAERENRMYKIELPEDFDLEGYKKYNPDLNGMQDLALRRHYFLHGKKENRIYKINLPEDFDLEGYKKYNPDLLAFPSDAAIERHYFEYGKNEKRVYKIELPPDFDYLQYKFLNSTLTLDSKDLLEAHYYKEGKEEGLSYKDNLFDKNFFINFNKIENYKDYTTYSFDITQIKHQSILDKINSLSREYSNNCILLINHNTKYLNGAVHYLYVIYEYLKNLTNKKIYILDPEYNSKIIEKYKPKEEDHLVYENDPTLLYHIINALNPNIVYLNCVNSQFLQIKPYFKANTFIHSHEVKEHFWKILPETPTFVVSDKIKNQYNNDENQIPFVQPPILSEDVIKELEYEKTLQVGSIHNLVSELDRSKITIGMCGTLDYRKNYLLFLELSKLFPQYNFVWIGGKMQIEREDLPNFYHIKETTTPFRYYNILDYFLLTSLVDPCPHVVLENLYIGNKVITFENNIYTDHKCELLKDMYFEYPGTIDLTSATDAINKFVSEKINLKKNEGKEYVLSKYKDLTQTFLKFIYEKI
mgnify:CR=1 FL=1